MMLIRATKQTLLLTVVLVVIVTQPARAGLFGPDVELLKPTQISERLHNEPVIFNTSESPLQVKTKSAAVGGFLVGMILSSAMASGGGGGGGATNAAQLNKQMQAETTITQHASANIQGVVTSAAASVSGQQSPTAAKLGPLPLVAQQLNRAFREQHVAIVDSATDSATDPAPTLKLSLTQQTWMLDFSMASSDYTLSSALTMELLDTRTGKIHLRLSCDRVYPKKMPLDAWEQDGHREVANAAKEIAQHCAKEFAMALNLPLPPQDTGPSVSADNVDEKPAITGETPPSDTRAPQAAAVALPSDDTPN
jgi:hypothetical protein